MSEAAHVADAALAHFAREHRPKAVPPEAVGLVAQIDAALERQILDVPQDDGKRTYMGTTSRMISSDELKHRNGLRALALDLRGINTS